MFQQHPLRHSLNDEVHARPPLPLRSPEQVSYLAFVHDARGAPGEVEHLQALAAQLELPPIAGESEHVSLDAGDLRIKWERHNEFSTYTFFRHGDTGDETALDFLPPAWLQGIPGKLMVATHVSLRSAREQSLDDWLSHSPQAQTSVVACGVADGAGWVATDFRICDGFSRFVILDESLTPRQAGRTVQRLLEIETYRVMALLSFPLAKTVGHLLSRAESELAALMDDMGRAGSTEDERGLLDRLTRLAAEVEKSVARTTFRFGATAAYHRLVVQRIDDLREVRISGFPTLREFMGRRLTPAVRTCESVARRQEDLSGRIARNSQLLRTRVDIELERQNQELLAQMNRRARLQLRLQETVEGLSIVAITYYGSQLVQYLSKGLGHWIDPLAPATLTAASIPVIAGIAYLGLRRMRRTVEREAGQVEP
jgi:uncharacterized membrane-anchored protein